MTTKYEWAKIELLGRRVRYGRCSVVDFMDSKLLRVEVQFAEPRFTHSETPVYEESELRRMPYTTLQELYLREIGGNPNVGLSDMVTNLCAMRQQHEKEQFAFVEEYPFSALYCRTPMTEENVRKAVQPWRPSTLASPQDKTSGHVEIDPWDGEDDSQPLRNVGKAMSEVLQPEVWKMWAYELPDRDGDILEIRQSIDPDTAAIINADRDWCADAEQLGALHECIGKILGGRELKADEQTHEAPAANVTQRAPHFVDIDEHSYVASHVDLDDCICCYGSVKTHPLVSIDGSAVLGDHCLACKGTWWNQTPTMPTPAMVRPSNPSKAF